MTDIEFISQVLAEHDKHNLFGIPDRSLEFFKDLKRVCGIDPYEEFQKIVVDENIDYEKKCGHN
jgi:hypothetical protein